MDCSGKQEETLHVKRNSQSWSSRMSINRMKHELGVVVQRPICTKWLQRVASSVREPVRMPFNRVEHDRVNVAQGGFTSSGYDHEWPSTAGWLTPSEKWSNTVRCKPRFSSFFSSLLCFFKIQKTEKQKLWSEGSNGGRQRDEEHPSSDTNCWEWTRPPVRKRSYNNLFKGKNLRMGDVKQHNTHRERERGTKSITLLTKVCNSYKWTTTFTKGYKVTLYSDSLRATALYANYINGPNLGTQRG